MWRNNNNSVAILFLLSVFTYQEGTRISSRRRLRTRGYQDEPFTREPRRNVTHLLKLFTEAINHSAAEFPPANVSEMRSAAGKLDEGARPQRFAPSNYDRSNLSREERPQYYIDPNGNLSPEDRGTSNASPRSPSLPRELPREDTELRRGDDAQNFTRSMDVLHNYMHGTNIDIELERLSDVAVIRFFRERLEIHRMQKFGGGPIATAGT